jgi:preprotein translocase subunit YajC
MDYRTIIWLVVLVGFFYFLIIRPEKKKQKQASDMMSSLRTGDEIMTRGGIYGTITLIEEDAITIATGPDDVKIKLSKLSVATVTKKAEEAGEAAPEEEPAETAADEIQEDNKEDRNE